MGVATILHYQPFKGVYLLYQVASTLCVRVPWWTITSIPRSWRPRPSWSFRKTFFITLTRYLSDLQLNWVGSIRNLPNHKALAPTKVTNGIQVKGIWVEPISPDLIIGKLKTWSLAASVEPIRIPGYWMHKNIEDKVGAPPTLGEKVVLSLHGGGYTQGSAHTDDMTSLIPLGLLQQGRCERIQRAFALEYRLTTLPPAKLESPFPSQLLDALAGYTYLVNQVGFRPEDIIIVGDSAGANLALQLTRYILDYESQLPLRKPGSLVLLSPWGDLGFSHENSPTTDSYTQNAPSDFLVDSCHVREYTIAGVLGTAAADFNPYISPASLRLPLPLETSFSKFPRTFIACGGGERIADSVRTLARKMEGVEGGMTYHEMPDAVHDWIIFSYWEPERTQTLDAIGKWIELTI